MTILVVDRATGDPLANAAVTLRVAGHWRTPITATTGPDGVVVVESPVKSTTMASLSAGKDGYAKLSRNWRKTGLANTDVVELPDAYTLRIEPATRIGGKVVDDQGKPVAGANIFMSIHRAYDVKGEETWITDEIVKTGPDGKWTFDGAPSELTSANIGTYHLDYAIGAFIPLKSATDASLRDGSFSLSLNPGIEVRGTILGPDGSPVHGAKVGIGTSRAASNTIPEFSSDEMGNFRFFADPEERAVVTVKADGFAPDQQQFRLSGEPRDLSFRLTLPNVLRGRVVDREGKPVGNASVYADTWRGTQTLQANIKTDADGRFVWENAPADAVSFSISAKGFRGIQDRLLTAGETEAQIVVSPSTVVTGTVVDAQTGKPIEAFTVLQGIKFDSRDVYWQNNEQDNQEGVDGAFGLELTTPRIGYAIRIRADGYAPADSHVFTQDQAKVELSFRMERATNIAGKLITLDGKPVVNAKVYPYTAADPLHFTDGQIVPMRGDIKSASSDENGSFSLPPDPQNFSIVVVADEGFAMSTKTQLLASPLVVVQPWAKVEGEAKIGNKLAAGATISGSIVGSFVGEGEDVNQPRLWYSFNSTVDEDGRFKMNRVPPVQVKIGRHLKLSNRSTVSTHSQALNAEPGETSTITLGGTGRRVIGRVELPEAVQRVQGYQFDFSYLTTHADFPDFPRPDGWEDMTMEQIEEWMDAYSKTDEGKARSARFEEINTLRRHYWFGVEADNTFAIDDVDAGEYDLTISVAAPPAFNTCGVGERIGTVSHRFTIPEMPTGRSDEPLELGTIVAKAEHNLKVGDAAPTMRFKSVDGTEHSLEEFRGKYVLLDFWATWCGPCVAEMPELKSLYETFGANDKFVMIGMSLDEKPETAANFAKKHDIAWMQAHLGAFDSPFVQAFGVKGIPSVWLIDPEGKVIAKNLRGESAKSAVGEALRR